VAFIFVHCYRSNIGAYKSAVMCVWFTASRGHSPDASLLLLLLLLMMMMPVFVVIWGLSLKPRLHQGNMLPERRQHVARQQIARSGNMLPTSRQHNYYSFMSRSTSIPLYPATDGLQTGNNFVADIQATCWGNRTHVAGNKLPWCKRG